MANGVRVSRTTGVLRTAIAVVVLLTFWGAIVYTFWPEILPALLRLVQSVRGIGAQEVESTLFIVHNNSTASEAQIRQAIRTLEADYAALYEFLGRQPDYRVPVLITNGPGPALTDGARLNVFYDGDEIDLSTAPFFLVLLGEGELSLPGLALFVEGSFAVYVANEIHRAQDLIGQPPDAWVTLFEQNGTLMPLSEAWTVELPESEVDLSDFVRALLEGGSFIRWMANTFGLGSVEDLRSGVSLEDITALTLTEAEPAWLASVASQSLQPQPCARVVPGSSPIHVLCARLDAARSTEQVPGIAYSDIGPQTR